MTARQHSLNIAAHAKGPPGEHTYLELTNYLANGYETLTKAYIIFTEGLHILNKTKCKQRGNDRYLVGAL